jgi:hypothetical protein
MDPGGPSPLKHARRFAGQGLLNERFPMTRSETLPLSCVRVAESRRTCRQGLSRGVLRRANHGSRLPMMGTARKSGTKYAAGPQATRRVKCEPQSGWKCG